MRPSRDADQIDLSLPEHLVGDVYLAALRIVCFRRRQSVAGNSNTHKRLGGVALEQLDGSLVVFVRDWKC